MLTPSQNLPFHVFWMWLEDDTDDYYTDDDDHEDDDYDDSGDESTFYYFSIQFVIKNIYKSGTGSGNQFSITF